MQIVYKNRVIELVDVSPEFLHDPVYYKKGWSNHPYMFLRPRVAEALRKAESLLPQKYRLFLFDAGRDYQTQLNMIAHFRAEKLRAEPEISEADLEHYIRLYTSTPRQEIVRLDGHHACGAVDLGLALRQTGECLNMGTGFDELVKESAQFYYTNRENLSEQEVVYEQRRHVLREAMLEAGFGYYPQEYWHFDYLLDEEEIMGMAQIC